MRMYLVSFRTVILVTITTLLCGACSRHGEAFSETISPDGRYKLVLRGLSSVPRLPFVNHVTSFEAINTRSAERVSGQLYVGDAYDETFLARYPRKVWLANNILRFAAADHQNASSRTDVRVRTEIDQPLSFIIIRSQDIILTISPDRAETYSFQMPRKSNRTFVAAEARTRAGQFLSVTREIVDGGSGAVTLGCDITLRLIRSEIECSWK